MDEKPANATNQAVLEQGGLEVVSIAKSYDKRAVLTDISLSVAKGEVLGLLGPNGAGKTTCFYSIMGLVRPDSGRILLDGVDITRLPMYRRAILGLGYLPQETSIFRGMTVEQNINTVLELVEPDKATRAAFPEDANVGYRCRERWRRGICARPAPLMKKNSSPPSAAEDRKKVSKVLSDLGNSSKSD